LEEPEKSQFADHILNNGGELLICPDKETLDEHIARADVVQLEWWHHPVMAGWMNSRVLPAMRLVVWSHISGLHPPEIPPAFLSTPHRFLFSSPCSFEHRNFLMLESDVRRRVDSVFSSGGFDDLPMTPRRHFEKEFLQAGYVGTLNFAKLHPGLMEYLSAVRLPNFRLALVGDPTTGTELLAQAAAAGLMDRLELRGYSTDVAADLSSFDVFAYLLNPLHYGTTENALLEAMAMGVVPVVFDNPAERQLIRNNETGLIVNSPSAFGDALHWLANHPGELRRLSESAAAQTRMRFAVSLTARSLATHYRTILAEDKRTFDFRPIFGESPAEWFRAAQGDEAWRFSDDLPEDRCMTDGPHFLYEKTKSSVFHYRDTFPGDARLESWARRLQDAREAPPCD
jgi:glycosyltransferase involved in cell wall biosynthesis